MVEVLDVIATVASRPLPRLTCLQTFVDGPDVSCHVLAWLAGRVLPASRRRFGLDSVWARPTMVLRSASGDARNTLPRVIYVRSCTRLSGFVSRDRVSPSSPSTPLTQVRATIRSEYLPCRVWCI